METFFRRAAIALLSWCALWFGGCAVTQEPQHINTPEQNVSVNNNNQHTYVSPDALLMGGLYGVQTGDSDIAKYSFGSLYELSGASEYLLELVRVLNAQNKQQEAVDVLEYYKTLHPNDMNIDKLLVTELFETRDLSKAAELAAKIADKTKDARDEEMAGDMFLAIDRPNEAMRYYEAAYIQTKNEKTLDKMALITYSRYGKKTDALAMYETHIRLYGCSKFICERLALAYQEQNNISGVIDVYKRLYFKTKEEKYFKKVVELSAAIGNINGLISFLKEAKADDKLLLEAYKYQKDYKNAIILSKKLWLKTKDVNYLAQYAMLRIDEYPDAKAPLKIVKESIADLETAVKTQKNDIYENFLGYLLIDYDINIPRGMDFVKKALEKDPTSPFYADSLAWGYYKLKECSQAAEWMKKAADKLSDDPVVKAHQEAINKCRK